jgi:hypothetical protein
MDPYEIDRLIDLLTDEYIELFLRQFQWVLMLVFVLMFVKLILIFLIIVKFGLGFFVDSILDDEFRVIRIPKRKKKVYNGCRRS